MLEEEEKKKEEKIPHMCESIGHRPLRGRCPKRRCHNGKKDCHNVKHTTLPQVSPLVTKLSLTVIFPGILCVLL